ncbi:MAG: hypothetical protein LBM65_01155 [Oscillospiraceae bacterium]|jgi:hypothetical protein|nr:hypothetical protein [Oscillospiraceae bacterium]
MTLPFDGKIYIKKRKAAQWSALYIFAMPFLLAFFGFLGVPDFIKYTIDIAWVLAAAFLIAQKRLNISRRLTPFVIFVFIFFLYNIIVYFFNFQSIFYYLWGFRNNFRFFFAFLAFAVFFDESDIKTCLKFIDVLFWVNAAVSFVQFFAMGYKQDLLGGIFGVERGANAYSAIFFAFVAAKSLLLFMNKQEKALPCFLKCSFTLILAALAELKFYFILFILVLIISAIFTSFSWRKLLLIIGFAIVIMFSSSILTAIFGSSNSLTFERLFILATSTSYANGEDLGRFTAIPTIAETILTDLPQQLFGMGMGNCDTSVFPICNTPFYQANSLLNYTWFSSAFLFLETGYIGLALYLSFFIICLVFAVKAIKAKTANKLYCQITVIMAVICICLIFYNSSMRMEVGYIAFFALALPLIPKERAPRI